MDILEGSFAVATFIVIALPGLVYSSIRRWARGETPEDRDFGLSVARGAVFSIALTALYLLVFGNSIGGITAGEGADTLLIRDPRALAATVLIFYLLVPAMGALLLNRKHLVWRSVGKITWMKLPQSRSGYTTTPTAWDHAVRRNSSSWVKIRKSDGTWIGGWFTKGSFASTYPEIKSIYIDQQHQISPEGDLGEAIPGAGVLLTIAENDVVFWIGSQREKHE